MCVCCKFTKYLQLAPEIQKIETSTLTSSLIIFIKMIQCILKQEGSAKFPTYYDNLSTFILKSNDSVYNNF